MRTYLCAHTMTI